MKNPNYGLPICEKNHLCWRYSSVGRVPTSLQTPALNNLGMVVHACGWSGVRHWLHSALNPVWRPMWEKQSAKQTTFTPRFPYFLYSLWLFSLPFPISFYANGDKWVAVTRLSLLPSAGSSWLFILWFDCDINLQHLDTTRSSGFIWPYRPLNKNPIQAHEVYLHGLIFSLSLQVLSHKSQCEGWALAGGKNARQLLGFAPK